MRHTLIYLKNARSPQNVDKVPIKEIFPLSLKNNVSGGMRATQQEFKCLYEMTLMFKCWTDNEFNDKMCTKQIEDLNKCVQNYAVYAAKQKELRKIDIPSPKAKSFTDKQITYLLHMYPTV